MSTEIERPLIVDTFTDYAIDQTERLANLAGVLGTAVPVLEHFDEPGGTNNLLIESGRTDLVIIDPAAMIPVDTPKEVAEKCNNFLPNFRMPIGRRETGELNMHNEPVTEPVPPTPDDILALRSIPKIESLDELDELKNSYAVLDIFNHSRTPAFIRMLNVWPDFTTDLVVRMSQPEEKNRYDHFEAELFVAYQLMSRLVDQADLHVLRGGEVDDWYLCR